MAHVVLQSVRLDASVAAVAERAPGVLYEPSVSELHVALLAAEARRMPVGVHRLDHAPDYELAWNMYLRSEYVIPKSNHIILCR